MVVVAEADEFTTLTQNSVLEYCIRYQYSESASNNGFDFLWVHPNSFLAHHESQEGDSALEQLTF